MAARFEVTARLKVTGYCTKGLQLMNLMGMKAPQAIKPAALTGRANRCRHEYSCLNNRYQA